MNLGFGPTGLTTPLSRQLIRTDVTGSASRRRERFVSAAEAASELVRPGVVRWRRRPSADVRQQRRAVPRAASSPPGAGLRAGIRGSVARARAASQRLPASVLRARALY